MKWHRDIPPEAKLGAAVVSRSAGKWFVCLQVELPDTASEERTFTPVGSDMGLTSLVALSTVETVSMPHHSTRAAKALRKAQRAVARKKRNSNRRHKAKLLVARLSAHVANQRLDLSHKLSRSLVDRFSHLAYENLNVTGLARGMLAKPVHDAAWNQLVQHVTYKAANAGGVVVLVDPRGTSQTSRSAAPSGSSPRAEDAPLWVPMRPRPRHGGGPCHPPTGGFRAGTRPSSAKPAGCRIACLRSRPFQRAELSPAVWIRAMFRALVGIGHGVSPFTPKA